MAVAYVFQVLTCSTLHSRKLLQCALIQSLSIPFHLSSFKIPIYERIPLCLGRLKELPTIMRDKRRQVCRVF